MPVSVTVISSRGPATRAVSRTSPRSVYLIPLDSRLRRMDVSATSSVSSVAGAPSSLTITSTGLPSAIGRASPRSRPNSARRSTCAGIGVQPPGLGLGHVEQVVNQGEQHRARVPDQLDLIQLLGVERAAIWPGLGQQPGQPDDGVQWGAQLVADVGPEPVLGFRRGAQPLGGLVQLSVQRHHPAVGLFQLAGQLAVQGHDAAVGFLQLGVEQQQLLLLLAQVLQGRDQVLVLPPQVVQRGLRVGRGQLGADRPQVGLERRPGAAWSCVPPPRWP